MNILSETEKAYIAGILDGEGTISLGKKIIGNNPGYSVFVQITNTNRLLIDWLKETIGFGRIVTTISKNPKWKNTYDLEFDTLESKDLLTVVLEYLIIKRPQALLILEFISKSRGNSLGKIKDPDLVLEHEFIYRELAALNKRGK